MEYGTPGPEGLVSGDWDGYPAPTSESWRHPILHPLLLMKALGRAGLTQFSRGLGVWFMSSKQSLVARILILRLLAA